MVSRRLAYPPTQITKDPGDTIRIDVEFTYQGPAYRETLYGVLYAGVEDEISGSAGTSALDIPESIDLTKITGSFVEIPVPNRAGETFGLLTKLGNIAKDKVPNVVVIRGVPPSPQVTGFKITSYY